MEALKGRYCGAKKESADYADYTERETKQFTQEANKQAAKKKVMSNE
jgi:hypothetical protein